MGGWVDLLMVRYISLLLFIGLAWGQNDFNKLVLRSNGYKTLPFSVIYDSTSHSRASLDFILINYRLNNHITQFNKDTKIKSQELCYADSRHHTCSKAKERYNGIMISNLYKTPECIFSFYSSLEYGR